MILDSHFVASGAACYCKVESGPVQARKRIPLIVKRVHVSGKIRVRLDLLWSQGYILRVAIGVIALILLPKLPPGSIVSKGCVLRA